MSWTPHKKHKLQTKKKKIDKLDIIKITHFCSPKYTFKKMNRQIPTGKIFVAHVSDKRLESKIHKELLQIQREKQTTQLKI